MIPTRISSHFYGKSVKLNKKILVEQHQFYQQNRKLPNNILANCTDQSENTASIQKQMSDLMSIVKSLKKRMESQQQALAAANNQSSLSQDFNNHGQRGRGRSFRSNWRGNYGRGNNSGISNGNFQSNYRGGFRGGRSRGRGHGGANGRCANRFQPERQLFKLASSSVAGQTEEVQSSNLNSSANCESTECTSEF